MNPVDKLRDSKLTMASGLSIAAANPATVGLQISDPAGSMETFVVAKTDLTIVSASQLKCELQESADGVTYDSRSPLQCLFDSGVVTTNTVIPAGTVVARFSNVGDEDKSYQKVLLTSATGNSGTVDIFAAMRG